MAIVSRNPMFCREASGSVRLEKLEITWWRFLSARGWSVRSPRATSAASRDVVDSGDPHDATGRI
jgi:hypothetical protein